MELNNKIASLRIEEADEITRILRNITKEVIQEKNEGIKKDTEKAIKKALREVERIVISIAE